MWINGPGSDHERMSDMQTQIPAVPVLFPLVSVLLLAAWLRLRDRLLPAGAAVLYLAAVIGVTLLPLQIATGRYANQLPWYEKGNIIPLLGFLAWRLLGRFAPAPAAATVPRGAVGDNWAGWT